MTPPANANERVVIAESGDVLLTLRNPGAPFAVWEREAEDGEAANTSVIKEEGKEDEDADQDLKVEGPPQKKRRIAERSRQGTEIQDVLGDNAERPCFVYQVSSQHLITASPKFKSEVMSWSENHKADDGFYHMDTADWDPEAFAILLNMLHLRFRQVPKELGLELLAKVAMLVDYYRCWEVFDLIANVWVTNAQRKHRIPYTYGRELMMWMLVSWVFKLDTVFDSTTNVALRKNNRPKIQDMELSIPPAVLQALESRRTEAIAEMIEVCHKWIDKYCNADLCTHAHGARQPFECSSMMLGALMKQLKPIGIISPRPTAPFDGLSIASLREQLVGMKSPNWYTRDTRTPHTCTLALTVAEDILDVSIKFNKGLKRSDFVDRGEDGAE